MKKSPMFPLFYETYFLPTRKVYHIMKRISYIFHFLCTCQNIVEKINKYSIDFRYKLAEPHPNILN